MEKDSKKNITPNINEELMMNMMVDGVKKKVWRSLKLMFQKFLMKILQKKMKLEKDFR